MEGGGKTAPLNTAINQLAGENQYSPPSLAGWQHSGVIKIVTIDKSRWMEHFLPVLLGSERESDYLCATYTHGGQTHKGLHVLSEWALHPRMCARCEQGYRRGCSSWGQAKAMPRGRKPRVHESISLSPTIIIGSLSFSRPLTALRDLVMREVHPSKW